MGAPQDLDVRPPSGEAEIRALVGVIGQSFAHFGRPPEFTDLLVKHCGPQNMRVGVRDGQVVATLGILYFGQWFGGHSVPSAGISAVGVAPHTRGMGVGAQLMRSVIRELRQRGTPLSVLYPSNYPLYRRAGYEVAGTRCQFELNPDRIGVADRSATIRLMRDADRPAVAELHREFGRSCAGVVDRTQREWRVILEPDSDTAYAYVIESPDSADRLEGYLVFTQHNDRDGLYQISLRDQAFRTPRAIRRALTFLADHSSMAGSVRYLGGPDDPFGMMTRDQCPRIRDRILWMLRIVDVPAALAERGYAPGFRGRIHFDVSDDLIAANNGRFVLDIAEGVGTVQPGGHGRLKLSVRGLAPLYSGQCSAEHLQSAELLAGPPEDLALASAAFAGPFPWMNERF